MATNESSSARWDDWLSRLKRARLALAVAALAFAGLWLAGVLALLPALVALAAVFAVAAVMAAGGDAARGAVSPDAVPAARVGEPLIEAVLAGLPDPVVALNRNGDVVALNAQASAIAPALRRGEQVSFGLRVPEVLDAIRRSRANGGTERVEFFERVPVDRWYEAIVTPIAQNKDAAAESARGLVLMTFHDLTPLRRVEEMRADFIANASHELRTPLASLSGFIETLQGPARADAAARERFLGIMQAQANRMARLIDDLLSLSRIELSAHLRPDKQADLVAIVRQVADGLQTLARDRGLEVRLALPAGPLVVHGDHDELLRVFENLLENALKYGASDQGIEVALSSGQGANGVREARIAVRDHGPGIAPEHLPRLTERFYRVDVSESRAQGGTGLGLALVKHILNRHGGRLTIESVLGQGATFTAHLPLAESPAGKSQR
jgi:two-component system phosphate regulon sensor histidine kinase PhoR